MAKFGLLKLVIYLSASFALGYLLFFARADVFDTRSWSHFWNLGHIPLFIFAVYLAYQFIPVLQQFSLVKQFTVLLVVGFLCGASIEIVQSYTGRESSMHDILLDLLGVLFGIPLFSTRFRHIKLNYKYAVFVCLIITLLFVLSPLTVSLIDEYREYRDFPVLSDFESPLEIGRWQGDAVREVSKSIVAHGDSALKITLHHQRYSGIDLAYFPEDWSANNILRFQVFNPQDYRIRLNVSLFDSQHEKNGRPFFDRFNSPFMIQPGWNEVMIFLDAVSLAPRDRVMDLSRMSGFYLFVVRPRAETVLYLDNVRLEE